MQVEAQDDVVIYKKKAKVFWIRFCLGVEMCNKVEFRAQNKKGIMFIKLIYSLIYNTNEKTRRRRNIWIKSSIYASSIRHEEL